MPLLLVGSEPREGFPSFVWAMFTAIARKYDRLNDLLSFGLHRRWRRFAASRSGLQPGGRVLDVATGTGEMARLLAGKGARVVGVDFCPAMLVQARAKLDGKKIDLVLGDALRLPFKDGAFESVTIGFALRDVADVGRTFSEMVRVTRAGGRVVSLEFARPGSRLVRTVYYGYLCYILPLIGGLLSGNRTAYRYLPWSIRTFLAPEEVRAIMKGAGLAPVRIFPLTLGTATIYEGTKQGRP